MTVYDGKIISYDMICDLLSKGNTAQFVGSVGDAFSAICCLQIFRFTSSKPSKSAIASDENSFASAPTHLCGIALE